MLSELHASHMLHATTAEPAYYQLADIFSWGLRNDLPRYFPDGKISYPGIGIFTRDVDGKTFVSGVLAGLPGDKGGLKVGDEIALRRRQAVRAGGVVPRQDGQERAHLGAPRAAGPGQSRSR